MKNRIFGAVLALMMLVGSGFSCVFAQANTTQEDFAPISLICLGYDSSQDMSERYSAVFMPGENVYEISVPYGQEGLEVVHTPFVETMDTNLLVGTPIKNGEANNFYYTDTVGNKVKFSIKLTDNYFAVAGSLILEVMYLAGVEVTAQNKQAVYKHMQGLQERYEALDFVYEKTYIYRQVDFYGYIYDIVKKLEDYDKNEINTPEELSELDEEIMSGINHKTDPLTPDDAPLVQELMGKYALLTQAEQNALEYGEELLLADEIMAHLLGGVVPRELFENIQGQSVRYAIEGNGDFAYTIAFQGHDINTPADVKTGVGDTPQSKSDIQKLANSVGEYFVFEHDDDFPANAAVTVETSLSDGIHRLYYFDGTEAEFVGEVEVEDGEFSFDTPKGGEFFIAKSLKTSEEVDTTQYSTGESGSSSATTTATQKVSVVVTTQSFDDIIPREGFEVIKGYDENVKGVGRIDHSSKTATFIFNGLDVKIPMDFTAGITFSGENSGDIQKLSPEALCISLEHVGELPGVALLEFATHLSDGQYILFKYDEVKMQAEVVEKIDIVGQVARIIVDENTDYFIAKSANLDSLSELEATLATDTQNTEHNSITWWIIAMYGVGGVLIIGVAVVALTQKKQKHEVEDED